MDGEVIAIHLGTGIYYSLRGSAATVWGALGQPSDGASLARVLAGQFEVGEEQARNDAATFARQLQQEQLVVAVETAVATKPMEPAAKRLPYTPPQLERYADLQDLLLLDPIHDVGAQGWPQRPADPQK